MREWHVRKLREYTVTTVTQSQQGRKLLILGVTVLNHIVTLQSPSSHLSSRNRHIPPRELRFGDPASFQD